MEAFDRLDLDDGAAVHEQVDAMVAEQLATISYLKRLLDLERNSACGQLDPNSCCVDRLAHARSKLAMHCNQRADHPLHEVLEICR